MECMVQAFFDEEWRAKQTELEDGQNNAAKQTIRKMEEKVWHLIVLRERHHHECILCLQN